MCGLAGILAYTPGSRPVDKAELHQLATTMAARGPDGSGLWLGSNQRVGLSHRRLAIIDPSPAGTQPMELQEAGLTIVFNGEIYNYRELRFDLENSGTRFRTKTDTEILLHLYARHGNAMVALLRGMFAFAIWDEHRGGVLLARDHFGIKPLYYTDQNGRIYFASQVKTLSTILTQNWAFDPAGLVGFLLFGSVPDPFTIHRGIQALPAGSTLWLDENGMGTPQTYFSIPTTLSAAERVTELPPLSPTVRAALLDSVRAHLIADVPIGLFLSAGSDSSVVLALATETCGQSIQTITLGFEEFRGSIHDETVGASAIAAHYNANHRTCLINHSDAIAATDAILTAMDQPSIDGVNTWLVARATASLGLKVALSGVGGDELFAGYPSFRQVPTLSTALAPFARMPALGRTFRRFATPLIRASASPKWAGLFEYGTTLPGAWLLRRALFMPWELPYLIDPDLAQAGWDELNLFERFQISIAGIRQPTLQVMALEMGLYLCNQLLRDADWAGMGHGVEIRAPLVDVELFRRLAPLLAAPPGLGKADLRTSARPALPSIVAQRPKTGFSTPLSQWLTQMPQPMEIPQRGLRGWALTLLHRWQSSARPSRP